jgi:uncharacterized repeat protein (TIGR04138 family)
MRDHQNFKNIVEQDARYTIEAYIFVLEALQYTRKKIHAKGHVTGQQLLEGIKDLALERYGSMAKMVFEHWGVAKTIDFGNIVINMVNEKILSKTPEDKLEDFKNVYNFDDVFVKEYQLKLNKRQHKHRSRNTNH